MNIQELLRGVDNESARNGKILHLTANEGYMSNTALSYLSTRLSERYFMGGGDEEGVVDYQPFTFLGYPSIGALITSAEEAAKRMLGAYYVNLSCLSGIHAMMCAILLTTEPGDTIMSVDLKHGGHFATKGIIERTGRKQIPTSYNFDTLSFDAESMARDFHSAGASALYLDVSFYINPHNLSEIRQAIGPIATIIYDASHTMGLIMGGRFQSPLSEGADVVCANTHKTLPGPQKGMIAFKDSSLAKKAQSIIFNGLFSSVHTASMLALSVTILEMQQYGKEFANQIILNSNALGKELELNGFRVRRANTGRYSENHQIHVFVDGRGHYRDLYRKLIANYISVNFDNNFGGEMLIRLGTQEITRRGMKEPEMKTIAGLLGRGLSGESTGDAATSLSQKFIKAHYSFDL